MVHLPLPPEGGPDGGEPCDTVDELMASLNRFALAYGYQLVKRNGTNPRNGIYTRYYVYCDRGAVRPDEGHGIRRSSIRKINCPFVATVKGDRFTGFKWVFYLHDATKLDHNHDPSEGPTAYLTSRRLTEPEKLMIRSMAQNNIQMRDIYACFKTAFPDYEVTYKDVNNYIQNCCREKLNGYTGTQAFVKYLQDNNLPYRIRYEEDDPTRIAGVTVEGFEGAWQRLINEFGEGQEDVVKYLEDTYFPYRYEWANCYTSSYRNYGIRTTSPVELSHKNLKSYLISNRGDLLKVAESLERMVRKMMDDYRDTLNAQSTRMRKTFLGRAWLGYLTMICSYKAVDLIAIKHRKAEACIPLPIRPPKTLRPCPPGGCAFERQCGLPCAFKIFKVMEKNDEQPYGGELQKSDVDTKWLTGRNLADGEPLLLIKEPYTQEPRRRPRNGAITLRQALSRHHGRRELHPTVRRYPSQWELIDLDSDEDEPN
ncbi:hypothetical protein DL768_011138 [Monosporascus sp. mg162]|nr:hypothetical protein DL768_011138 [Monosporascus sp. mg162]